jgi:hypothetical protein
MKLHRASTVRPPLVLSVSPIIMDYPELVAPRTCRKVLPQEHAGRSGCCVIEMIFRDTYSYIQNSTTSIIGPFCYI